MDGFLGDTTSHSLEIQSQFVQREPFVCRGVSLSYTTGITQLEALQRLEHFDRVSYLDPAYLQQIVKAVVSEMRGTISTTGKESIHTLLFQVKCIRDIGCVPFTRGKDVEVAGQWLQNVQESLVHIPMPKEIKVNCVAQLFSDNTQTWWTTIRTRRTGDELSKADFQRELEIRYYSRQHQRSKEQGARVLRIETRKLDNRTI